MIFGQSNFDCVISDTVFQGNGSYNPHHDLASIQLYPYDYFSIADYKLFWRSDSTPVHIGGNESLFSTQLTLAEWKAGLVSAAVPAAARQQNSIESDPQFVALADDNYRLADNGQAALTASNTGGPVGCYITGDEEIGLRATPTF